MRISFVAGFGPIVRDVDASQSFYEGALAFEGGGGAYKFTEKLDGAKHLGLWPLSAAAQACFGTDEWPSDIPEPQATLEFEVEDANAVSEAADELQASGHDLNHGAKEEPWGQTIARLMSPEGLISGISYTPWHHKD